jgi:hypothetical protein
MPHQMHVRMAALRHSIERSFHEQPGLTVIRQILIILGCITSGPGRRVCAARAG